MALTYEPIATVTVASTGSTVTFSSIPGTYTDFVLVSSARRGVDGSGGAGLNIQVNGDSGTNYSSIGYSYNIVGTGASKSNNQNNIFAGNCEDGIYTASICHFMNYANTSNFKSMITRTASVGSQGIGVAINTWRSTAAITSIFINPVSGLWAGSTFTLYGIKAA